MSTFSKIIKQNQHGILAPYLEGYINYLLVEKNYTRWAIYHRLNFIQHFGKYLCKVGMKNFSKVSSVTIKKFLQYYIHRFTYKYKKPLESKGYLITIKMFIRHFLIYLSQQGATKFNYYRKTYEDKIPRLMRNIIKEYFNFCHKQQGIKEGSMYLYRTWILRFTNFIKRKKIENIRKLKITDIDEFMSKYTAKLGRTSIYALHCVLRSFLNYLYIYSYIDTDMSQYILPSKTYASRLIPKHISWKQIRNILKQVDTTTANGKMLYAILILFISYGLRPIEISKLKLFNIHWSKEEIIISDRKAAKDLLLPLKPDVGYAILQYLKIRPDGPYNELFLTFSLPYRPLTPSHIRAIVKRYLKSTGIELPTKGLYIFRHSLAKRLIDKGASIIDISSILGHGQLSSTMKYLRISTEELREVTDNYANLL